MRALLLGQAALLGFSVLITPAQAGRLLISANDGKYVLAPDGTYQLANPIAPDTLTIVDTTISPPRVVATVEVDDSVIGPPSEVALSPAEDIAVVSAPKRVRPGAGPSLDDLNELQVVDLTAQPASVVAHVKLPSEPYGIAFNTQGTLLAVAHFDGQVSLVRVQGKQLTPLQTLRIAPETARISQLAFTPDGRFALASRRDETKVQVLRVDGERLVDTGQFVSAGAQVYTLDVAADGRFALVSNVGWVNGDVDTVSVIDLRAMPFRTAAYVNVPSTPEGIAISPDGKFAAVSSINGSNLPEGHRMHQAAGSVGLFRIEESGALTLVGTAPTGVNAQGVTFTPDGRWVVVQDYMGKQLLFFGVSGEGLTPQPVWALPVLGHPAAIRIAPGPPPR